MRARQLALICVTALLGLACDAPTTAEPDAKSAEREAELHDGALEARVDEPTRDLAQLERELSGNETKLRQLGVPIAVVALDGEPGAVVEESVATQAGKAESAGDGSGGRHAPAKDRVDTKTASGTKKTKQDKKASGAGMAPGTSPSPAPKQQQPDPDATIAVDDEARAEAKSIQNPPTDRPIEQSEERCPLICSLADSTCDLTDEICELADRHIDEDPYSLACERASTDCKLAREACLECLE